MPNLSSTKLKKINQLQGIPRSDYKKPNKIKENYLAIFLTSLDEPP
jgi:hypothetical protein